MKTPKQEYELLIVEILWFLKVHLKKKKDLKSDCKDYVQR